jgi:hypothetical protein
LITVAKRKHPGKAKVGYRSKAGRFCGRCGEVLGVGALLCMTCAGQANSVAAQAKPASPAAHSVVFKQPPAQQRPPLYSTLVEQGWRPRESPDDQDRPEPDMTLWVSSGASVTGTASTFDVDGGPIQLPWNPYGD